MIFHRTITKKDFLSCWKKKTLVTEQKNWHRQKKPKQERDKILLRLWYLVPKDKITRGGGGGGGGGGDKIQGGQDKLGDQWPWPIFDTFYVDVRYLLNYKAYNHHILHSASPWCTDLAGTLTQWPWPIFYTPVTFTHSCWRSIIIGLYNTKSH